MNSLIVILNSATILTTLNPPLVEPAHAPLNITIDRTIHVMGIQPIMFDDRNPVVVSIETTWKSACLMAVGTS